MKIRIPVKLRPLLAGTALAATLLTGACSTPTPYRPAMGTGNYQTGYSDQRIEDNRYSVTFSGNSLTSRETVERYLLFRAAQLTLEQGYDYFILTDRNTEKKSNSYIDPDPLMGPYGYWSPYWRYYSPAWGWRSWDPFWGGPAWGGGGADIRTVTRYQAMAEIVMGKGPKPADNVRAFDARAVIANLGPTIMMPKRN
ncbi:hypothetical protein GCM10023219_21100 [Stakelama sediminis]|uniref:CC0125/CC1285 family lipoprotein n=1 Tax=Stakelama sediminis TaxID=463200 RepID=UPI001606F787